MKLAFSVLLAAAMLLPARSLCAAPSPGADEIIRRVIQQTDDPELNQARQSFAYQRTSRVDYLDSDGDVEKQSVRLYQIIPENGKAVPHLQSINGHPPGEKTEKHKSAARETGEKSRGLKLNRELLSRFDYAFEGEDKVAGREVWVLKVMPKPDAPEDAYTDKLINAMSGRIWVDKEDAQLAKADLQLSHRVSFFGGIAGAIEQLHVQLIQKRVAPAVWLSEAIVLDLSGRKLFSPVRLKCFENCSDFRKVPADRMSLAN